MSQVNQSKVNVTVSFIRKIAQVLDEESPEFRGYVRQHLRLMMDDDVNNGEEEVGKEEVFYSLCDAIDALGYVYR